MLHWEELGSVPQAPGLYAWYFAPRVPDADVEECIGKVIDSPDDGRNHVRRFLEDSVGSYYRQDEYEARLMGDLKPFYVGKVAHVRHWDGATLQKLVDNPSMLRDVCNFIPAALPEFMAPIYIGMSSDLRRRLREHKRAMLAESGRGPRVDVSDDWPESAQRFTAEVVRRQMPVSDLRVAVKPISDGLDPAVVEFLLNRLTYPLLGRL